jgi:hypothetical protein
LKLCPPLPQENGPTVIKQGGSSVYFCYVDESGYGSEPILTMAGVLVNATRMHRTKSEWEDFIKHLEDRIGRPVDELKTAKFYRGKEIYYTLDGNERSEYINAILEWLGNRRHKLAFSAVEKEKLNNLPWHRHKDIQQRDVETYWRACALHLILSIQKKLQGKQKKKGHTVFVFDREKKEELSISTLMSNPPIWTDTFYKKQRTQERLDMVVDVPFFADSKAVGLIQVADLYSYLLRRYAELSKGFITPEYDGELEKVTEWVRRFGAYTIEDSMRWPASRCCACADFFHAIGPDCLKNIVREATTGKKGSGLQI